MTTELWIHQKRAIHMLRASIHAGNRTPMLMMPTGSGKTTVAGEIIRSAVEKGARVGFIVDRLALVDQASAHLDSVGIDHGVIQGNHWRARPHEPVQVISAQTLARRRPWEMTLGIIDEAHVVHQSHKNLITGWDRIPFIGLSATPWTKGLGKLYDDLLIPTTVSELIELGHLVDADYYGPSEPDMKGAKIVAGDYSQREAATRSDTPELVASITETWAGLGRDRQTICFASNVAHSQHIVERFTAMGVPAVHIDAYTDSEDRRRAIQMFNDGSVRLLSSVGVLTTGFDSPVAEVGIMARPTKSLMLHVQMIGRVIRSHPGKEKALILDHAGNTARLGYITDDLPTEMSMGERRDSVNKRKKNDPLPTRCPSCGFMKPPGKHVCPACGHIPKRKNYTVERKNDIVERDGRLTKVKAGASPEERRNMYAGLLYVAKQRGYKTGWAYNAFKKKFGSWPSPTLKQCVGPEHREEADKWAKHLAIRYSKRRAS